MRFVSKWTTCTVQSTRDLTPEIREIVLRPGARIDASSPASLFEIDWTRQTYCLIAGGIGITPIIGIAGALMRRNADVELHYAVTSRHDAAFLGELSDLLGDRLIVHASD